MNTLISLWLRSAARRDLNIRSAYMHMLGDAVSAAGVVVAGFIVAFTGPRSLTPRFNPDRINDSVELVVHPQGVG
jgi:Co/Zn/Cd efflux system component